MKDFIYLAIIIALAAWALSKMQNNEEKPDNKDHASDYQRKMLLTKNEWKNYMAIRPFLEGEGLQICPKVRLLDLIEPKKGYDAKQRRTLLNKIQSKHVDFTVCDEKLNVLLILELDDSSHDAPARQQRDDFVDAVLTGAGHKILHLRNFEKELDLIKTTLQEIRNPDGQKIEVPSVTK